MVEVTNLVSDPRVVQVVAQKLHTDAIDARLNTEAVPFPGLKTRTEKATIRFMRRDDQGVPVPVAQGVLVPGGHILTAAHCIDWDVTGRMTYGEYYIETIKASDGRTYKVSPCAVEPMLDIAALVAVDGQELFEECEAFEAFCEATEPVPVSSDDFQVETQVRVHVLTHNKGWVTGRACRYGHPTLPPHAAVFVDFDAPIEGGTSGGPVIDDNGLLVGVISQSGGVDGQPESGLIPRPHLALPVWVWRRVSSARPLAAPRGADDQEGAMTEISDVG